MPRNIRNTRRNFARPSNTLTATASTSAITITDGLMSSSVTINKVSNPLGPVGNSNYVITSTPAAISTTSSNTASSFTATVVIPPGSPSGNYDLNIAENNYNGTGKPVVLTSAVTGVPSTINSSILVIAGGGGSGGNGGNNESAGGSGAGGYREFSSYALQTATNYTVTVGAGGAAGGLGTAGANGSNSVFSNITATGGGLSRQPNSATYTGGTGGSGGGGGGFGDNVARPGGSATSITPFPTVELYTVQGFNGGNGYQTGTGSLVASGGGGGAGGAGGNGSSNTPGTAGAGRASSITGSSVTRASGGAGRAASLGFSPGSNAAANTGNGTTGANNNTSGGAQVGGSGGSGVVILRYPNTNTITIGAGLTGSTAADGSFTVATITAGTGNVSFA